MNKEKNKDSEPAASDKKPIDQSMSDEDRPKPRPKRGWEEAPADPPEGNTVLSDF